MNKCIVSVLMVLLFSISMFGNESGMIEDEYSARQFLASDGLPQMQISTLYTDSKGFVWIGTRYTFAKWNGKNLISYTNQLKESYEYVQGFEEFPNSNILVFFKPLNNDIIKFVTVCGSKVKHYKLIGAMFNNIEQLNIDPVNDSLIQITFIRDQKLYTYFFDREKNTISKGVFTTGAKWILRVEDGIVYYTNNAEVTKKMGEYKMLKSGEILTQKFVVNKLFEHSQKISHRNKELSKSFIDYEKNELIHFEVSASKKLNLFYHPLPFKVVSGQSIIANISGVLYENSSKQYKYYDFNKVYTINNIPIPYCIEKDKSGNLYIGTDLGLFNFFKMGIREIKLRLNDDFDNIWSMTRDKKGVYYFSSFTNGIFKSKDKKTFEKVSIPVVDNTGGFGFICNDKNDLLIPVSMKGRIPFLSNNKLQLFDFPKGREIYTSTIDPLTQDIYFSNITMIFKFDAKTKKMAHFQTALDTLKKNNIISIAFTKDRQLAVKTSSESYLVSLNGSYKELTTFKRLGYAILCDKNNGIWENYSSSLICTRNGNSQYLKKLKISTSILSMIEYGKWLVIGTYRDIIFFDLEEWYRSGKEKYIAYTIGNDLNTLEGNQNNFFFDKTDSTIYWPCLDKILQFDPRILTNVDTIPPKVTVDEIIVYNGNKKMSLTKSLNQDEYRLGKDIRNIDIGFSNPLYVKNSYLKYRYRITPNSVWIDLQSNQLLRLINISPGIYTLEIQSSFDGIKWSESEKIPPLIIQARYYETGFFWIFFFVIVFALGSMIVIFFLEKQKIKHRHEVKKQLEKNSLQLQVIKSKYIPHFTFNAITSITYLLRKKEIRKASSYLVKMTELQRIALTNFEKPEIEIETELKFLNNYLSLEKLRFEESLVYKIILDKNIDVNTLVPNLCIHTMVENAIKHGLYNKIESDWMLRIYVIKFKNKIILSVEDNGVGVGNVNETKKNSTGTGLVMLDRQLKILNSDSIKYSFKLENLYSASGQIRGARSSIVIEKTGMGYGMKS